jgi:AraC-like DNA-binding protein
MAPRTLHPEIERADVLKGDPRWKWDTAGESGRPFVLWLITDGKGTLSAGPDSFELRTGDCLISPLWEPHHGRHDPDDRLTIYWVAFHFLSESGAQSVPDPLPKRYRRMGQWGFVRDLLQRAIASFNDGRTAEAHHWLNAVLIEIARVDDEDALRGVEREQRLAIQHIAAGIREQPGEPWLLDGLAGKLGVTPDHFIRVFRRFMSMTPREFIIRARVERACNLLRFSALSITEIAGELGFCDVHYFSRQFSARTGVSPSAFRKTG